MASKLKNELKRSRKISISTLLQSKIDILKKTTDNDEIKRRRAEESVDNDCELYNFNPPEVPVKFLKDAAETFDLLQVSSDDHYQEKNTKK